MLISSTVICSGLNPFWDNITTDKEFPIDVGSVLQLNLRCEEGYEHKGSQSVTCERNGQLGYAIEPFCSKG